MPTSAAVAIDRAPSANRGQTLEYSQSLNERNTFYFNRCTAGPSSGPQDPTMLPTVLELPPPSLEASAGSSPPPRIAALSASAPASTGAVGSWRETYRRSMRPSKDDAVPAKITENGTPTIFSFLTSMDGMESKAANAAKDLQSSFDSISLSGPDDGGAGDAGGGQDAAGQEADDMFNLDDL